jgi:hypothetical protein
MTFSITYTKQLSLNSEPALQPGQVRLVIQVTSVVGFVDKGMFVYQVDQAIGQPYYSHPATPIDLQDYYFNVVGGKPFVREDHVDRLYETASLAEADATAIEAALQQLCIDEQALQDLGTAAVVTVTAS